MTRAGPRACKRDSNHAECMGGAYGRDVLDLAAYGCPVDAAVWIAGNLWMLCDAKSSHRAPLTKWQQEHAEQIAFVVDAQEMADAVGEAARRVR